MNRRIVWGHVLEAHDTGENSRTTSILGVSRRIVGGHVLEAHDTGENSCATSILDVTPEKEFFRTLPGSDYH